MLGILVACFYARQGLTLSHYDAKAHLVVARRVLDSLTPGPSQIGAVWLPLPHLLNLLPVQFDLFYRTGASAVAISVLSFGLACYAIARIVLRVTGSRIGALAAVALFAFDPDILYLQSTPMTEPFLFGLTLLSVSLAADWVARGGDSEPKAAGWALVAACLHRYEAWFVTAALVGLTGVALVRRGSICQGDQVHRESAIYPISPSWLSFCTAGSRLAMVCHRRLFRDRSAHPGTAARVFPSGVVRIRQLANDPLVALSVAGVALVAVRGLRYRDQAADLVVLALTAFLVLPTYAFFEGHPFRMRNNDRVDCGRGGVCGIALGDEWSGDGEWLRPPRERSWWRHDTAA